ncbi:hypothetical protein QUB63_28315 [Microcoleus sp. ARI1-B5]|uniref:hypothetical protein n=1 Tax=unclassified Microcoleus TaxID=2642155 RepID=UPI002FD3541E
MSKSSSREIGEKIAIGVGVTVGSTIVLGTIGSLLTANPAPLLAALKIGAAIGGVGAGTSGGGSGGNS